MDDDAIQTDAEETREDAELKVGDHEERPLSEREEMMERIAANREAILTGEAGSDEVEKNGEQGEQKNNSPDSTETDRKIRVKVDGEEMELPLSEVVKGYQKEASASKRLEEAANRKKELDAKEAELKSLEEQLSRAPDKAKADGDAGGESTEDELDEALDALLEGDRSKFREILKSSKGRQEASTPELKPEDIDSLLETRLAQREVKREHAEAQAAFKKDFADIFGDSDLLAAANKRYYAKLDEGKSITDAMLEAGKETREWVLAKAGVKTPTNREERLQRKSQLTILPVRGGRSGTRVDEDNAPQDRSSIIAEIGKSRRADL